jgi:uncharacterized membrane protein (DUF4010 family)
MHVALPSWPDATRADKKGIVMDILQSPYPLDDVANKIGLSLGVGLLVGFEREWAQKEVGVRTFTIVALLGTLTTLDTPGLVLMGFVGTLLTVALLNTQSLLKDKSLELTTSAAMMVMFVLGSLIGSGHYFTGATGAILLTMLLAWKVELARFADALQPEEIRGAVLLGLLTFVIYPLLPNRFIDNLELINPRQAWVTIVAIAGIGFFNYVLLRIFSRRGLLYAAMLGGMVNSTATVVELAALLRRPGKSMDPQAESILLLTNVAMFVRNIVLLALFSPPSVADAFLPLGVMAGAQLFMAWLGRVAEVQAPSSIKLSSPVSLMRVGKFGGLFLALACISTLAQRYFGSFGFLVISMLGGVISSASATATAASLAASNQVTPAMAGMATVLAGISSALVSLPLVYQETRDRRLTRRLALITCSTSLLGLAVMLVDCYLQRPGSA